MGAYRSNPSTHLGHVEQGLRTDFSRGLLHQIQFIPYVHWLGWEEKNCSVQLLGQYTNM